MRSTQPFALGLCARATEPPLAALEVRDCVEELALPEVRPQGVGDVDLRVRDLPEKEIADAHLAARANEQIGVGNSGRPEMRGHERLVDVVGIDFLASYAASDGSHRVRD